MARLLLNLVTLLLVLLGLMSVWAWVLGTWSHDLFLYRLTDAQGHRTGDVAAWSWRGSLLVQVGRLERPAGGSKAVLEPVPGPAEFARWRANPTMSPLDPTSGGFAGFGHGSYAYLFGPSVGSYSPLSVTAHVLMVPWYAIVLVTAAMPLVRI